ncbi:hypothetical protein OG413_40290 [Streptomyces sp. NBC_01433]|uniref:hypothetical protein n=1 Tax=Streptomyces sp. NBC_01433 TaxID=2903864 RepID=UPI0022594BBC|nr:hypothetical protein [Streptomyces sp. NBC_01433]MCX4681440.1 hypothetical protein [Streptomyces sp. NBC_01433]
MTTTSAPTALENLLRRALLAFDARALHTGGEAGAHTALFLGGLAADILPAMDVSTGQTQEELAEAYRCLSLAGENPLRQSCAERESMVNIAVHALARALVRRNQGSAPSEDEVHELLSSLWTPSLLAWSQLFPEHLDGASPPCACGALGTRPILAPDDAKLRASPR